MCCKVDMEVRYSIAWMRHSVVMSSKRVFKKVCQLEKWTTN